VSLEDLKVNISNCNSCGENRFCPFPTYNDVKGFYGDKDYIFVAAQPSESIFPTKWDERLYYCMDKYGFRDAHLTDLVKCRGDAGRELSQMEVAKCVWWLNEEVKIVNPKVIIALGNRSYTELIRRFRPVIGVTHYSNRFMSDTDYEKEFQRLRECLDSGNYHHDMKISQLSRNGTKKDRQLRFREFVEELKRKRVRDEDYRDAVAKWNKENPT